MKKLLPLLLILLPFMGGAQCLSLGEIDEISLRSFARSYQPKNDVCQTYPLTIHILHEGEEIGTGHNLSDNQINSAIESLNLYWHNEGIYHVDTGIAFPQTFTLDTINRLNLAAIYPYYPEAGINTGNITNPTNGVSAATIRNYVDDVQGFDRDSVFNVFIYNQVGNILGFAWLGNVANGMWVKSTEFGDTAFLEGDDFFYGFPDNLTTVHEMGHIFGLLHTFQNTNNDCTPAQTEDNCNIVNDRVCDTPTERQTWGCTPQCGVNSRNHMGYRFCRDQFTAGQLERALLVEANPFNDFSDYARCEPEEPPAEPVWPIIGSVLLTNCDSETEVLFKTLNTDSVTDWRMTVTYNYLNGIEEDDSTVVVFDEMFPNVVDSVVTLHTFDLAECNLCLVEVDLMLEDSIIANTINKIECVINDLDCGYQIIGDYFYLPENWHWYIVFNITLQETHDITEPLISGHWYAFKVIFNDDTTCRIKFIHNNN